MKRIICLICLIVVSCIIMQPANAAKDTINMINGTVMKGKIERVTGGIINVYTKEGFRKFTRIQVLNNRDFVELGWTKTKIIAGTVFSASRWVVELKTPEGLLKIPRWRVKRIVLGHIHQPEEQLKIQLPEQVEETQKNLQ